MLLATRNYTVPLLPVVYYGHEGFWVNLRRFKRTDYHLRVGNPFSIDIRGKELTRPLRQEIADEIWTKSGVYCGLADQYQDGNWLPPG